LAKVAYFSFCPPPPIRSDAITLTEGLHQQQ
jgi:hypothetical protein